MKKISAKELLNLLNSQWADTNDIKLVAQCGKNKALTIKREISEQLKADNFYLPYGKIPMSSLIDYCGIDVSYLKKVCGSSTNEK